MNPRRHAILVPLFAVMAMLLGLGGIAAAAFNPAAQNPHYGENLLWEAEVSGFARLQPADPVRGNGAWVYDNASGVPVYVGHNPWSAFDPHGLASTIPVTSGEIGYVGEPSVTANDPPMISYGPNRDSGTAGSQHPYGYSPGGGPGVTVDPVSDAVGSQPSHLMDNALDACAWVREISRGYSFGHDYLGGVMGAGYPEDSPTRTATRAQQRELAERDNSPAYKFGDLFAGMVGLPGKAGAFAINTITMADITSAPLEYDLSRGFHLGENSPHVQLATAGILFLGGPIGRGGSAVVDDAFHVLHNGSWVQLNQRSLATFMKTNGYQGGPVRLLSCSSDACPTGVAKNLSNKLGAQVTAPSDTLWIHSNGTLTIGPSATSNTGLWNIFTPGKP